MPSDAEAASVAAVAVASIARPSSQRVRNMQRDRAATDRIVSQAMHADALAARTPVTGEAPAILASQTDPARRDPFAEAAATPLQAPSRPWPRAVLPQYNGNGALAADYATAPSYYPFSPREPEQRDTAPAREGVDASTQPAPQP
jgi:Meckel syndrome type 1 protein